MVIMIIINLKGNFVKLVRVAVVQSGDHESTGELVQNAEQSYYAPSCRGKKNIFSGTFSSYVFP